MFASMLTHLERSVQPMTWNLCIGHEYHITNSGDQLRVFVNEQLM